MRVLDIDLDFFLADCCPLAALGARPAFTGHAPWEPAAVERFLEVQCGLDKARPVEGAVFSTHDGALLYWRDRILEGRLTVPFTVTHIDAHSDLGIGAPGPGYVLQSVLCRPAGERPEPERYREIHQLDEANYLLFALAFRWVERLENVRNSNSRKDMPEGFVTTNAAGQTQMRLCSFASRLLEAKNGPEPVISYTQYDDPAGFYTAQPYDFITLACSPRYAPEAADALIPVIAQYIKH